MKQCKMLLIGSCLMLGVLTGCANTQTKEVSSTPQVTDTEEINEIEEVKEDKEVKENKEVPTFVETQEAYQKMIHRSLVSTGNNQRLKKAIEKAKSGEAVNIAYIGGSITEGAAASAGKCYADQSFESFKEMFSQGDHVKYVNAGMGGTPSALGIIRYERDVIDRLETLPDIVFVEFSVNDWEEPTKGRAYESMIESILNAENEPAVVLVFSVFQSRWNLQDLYIPLGNAYGLPMVSIRDAVVPALDEEKTLTDEEFFADSYHPTNYGHKIMTDCLTYLFETIDGEELCETDIKMPATPVIGNDFVGIKMVDRQHTHEDVVIQPGSFKSVDEVLVPIQNLGGMKTFPENWMHGTQDGDEAFKITTTCKNLMLVYKQSNSSEAGSAEVYIDGQLTQTLNAYSEGGWNNPITALVLDEKVSGPHTIEIRMAEGDEDKTFSILALGYTQ